MILPAGFTAGGGEHRSTDFNARCAGRAARGWSRTFLETLAHPEPTQPVPGLRFRLLTTRVSPYRPEPSIHINWMRSARSAVSDLGSYT